jgi:hypothetical protein
MGSGSPEYGGWYMNLFENTESSFEFKPEVSTMMTAVNDDRGPGAVVHLGTGPTQIMYILANDVIEILLW